MQLAFNLLLKDESVDQKWLVRPKDLAIPPGSKFALAEIQIWDMVLPEGSEDFVCLGHAVSDSRLNKLGTQNKNLVSYDRPCSKSMKSPMICVNRSGYPNHFSTPLSFPYRASQSL